MKSIFPSGPLKTKLIIINYNNHDKINAYLQLMIIIKDLKNSSILPSGPLKTNYNIACVVALYKSY